MGPLRRRKAPADFVDPDLLSRVEQLVAADLDEEPGQFRLSVASVERRGRTNLISLTVHVADRTIPLILKQLAAGMEAPTAPNAVGRRGEPRPRLAVPCSLADRYRLEQAALVATEHHIRALADPRLTAVHVVGYLPADVGIVTTRLDAHHLRDPIRRAITRRPRRRSGEVDEVLAATERAGAWLRAYHSMQTPDAAQRHASPASIAGWVSEVSTFLGQNLDEAAYFSALAARIDDRIRTDLPEPIPLALAHGDFAPRNVLVGRDGRVAAVDMAGAIRAPIYEDLAYYVSSIRTSMASVLAGPVLLDHSVIAGIEQALMAGYFGSETPHWKACRLYQVLLTLDKWWGSPPRLASTVGGRIVDRVATPIAERALRAEVDRLLS